MLPLVTHTPTGRSPIGWGVPATVTTVLAPVSAEPPVRMPVWAKLTRYWVAYVPVIVVPASAAPSVPLAVLVSV